MQYQVFVQSHPENKFIASIVGIPNSTVEGSTKEEAIALAKAALEAQLALGEIVTIEVGQERSQQETDPWLKHMGIFASDPTLTIFWQKLQLIVSKFRRMRFLNDLLRNGYRSS